jgi:hypothetical protein
MGGLYLNESHIYRMRGYGVDSSDKWTWSRTTAILINYTANFHLIFCKVAYFFEVLRQRKTWSLQWSAVGFSTLLSWQQSYFRYNIWEICQKFWEEIIVYFSLIRHGLRRKRRLQQFFVAAETYLPSCYLATIGGYRDRFTDTRVQQFFYCCVYPLLRERVHGAVSQQWKECYTLPSLCLATTRGIHIQTHRLMGVRRWDGLRCHDIHTKFHKDWFRHLKANREEFTDTQTAWRSHKPTFIFFKRIKVD